MNGSHAISALRKRLDLQSYNDVPDASGGFERQWQSVAEIWAQVEPSRPQSRFEAGRPEAKISVRIMLRWRPDVTAAMRFKDGDQFYRIVAAHDADTRRKYLVCYCEEVVS